MFAQENMVILAVDIGAIIAVAFLIISFIGWIMNLITGNQPKQPQRRRQPQRRQRAEELDTFLEDAGAGKRQPQQNRMPHQAEDDLVLEIVSEDEIETREREAARQRSREKARQKQMRRQRQAEKRREAARSSLENRHVVASEQLGQGVSSRHVDHAVDESVDLHLGSFSLSDNDEGEESPRHDTHPIAAMLQSPEGFRQAILLNEILTRPGRR